MPALKHRSRALGGRMVAERTMEFTFEKPPGFHFRPGQAIELALLNPSEADPRGNAHTFSIASPPSSPTLQIASRMRDTAFKRSLHSLTPGAQVELEGPFGSFRLHRDRARPAAMLAGGIGVTPFMSMIRETLLGPEDRELSLFCSNRRPQDAPYLEELRALAAARPSFHLVPTITRPDPSSRDWAGEKGPISRELLGRHLADLRAPVFYVAGPPGFVESMRELLESAAVAEGDVRSEEFVGY